MADQVRFEDPRTVLKRHGLSPKHSWGQNFLVSGRAIAIIASACVDQPGRRIIEIGAGLGTLTGAILDVGGRITAVERDREMCAVLREEFGGNADFDLVEADAATFDYVSFLSTQPSVIVGNLPYQLTGRLLRILLENSRYFLRAVLMVQEEVANRIVARKNDKARGALSVNAQARCHAKIIHRLGPTAFHPKPKVRSAVVVFEPLDQPLFSDGKEEADFETVVKAAFSCRRKIVRNALSIGGLGSHDRVTQLLTDVGIDPGIRPSSLSLKDFCNLAKRYGHQEND
jgi:16S rRNA (adenine1518-N6/adenine1519-N6)-dimethyltransferase